MKDYYIISYAFYDHNYCVLTSLTSFKIPNLKASRKTYNNRLSDLLLTVGICGFELSAKSR